MSSFPLLVPNATLLVGEDANPIPMYYKRISKQVIRVDALDSKKGYMWFHLPAQALDVVNTKMACKGRFHETQYLVQANKACCLSCISFENVDKKGKFLLIFDHSNYVGTLKIHA